MRRARNAHRVAQSARPDRSGWRSGWAAPRAIVAAGPFSGVREPAGYISTRLFHAVRDPGLPTNRTLSLPDRQGSSCFSPGPLVVNELCPATRLAASPFENGALNSRILFVSCIGDPENPDESKVMYRRNR